MTDSRPDRLAYVKLIHYFASSKTILGSERYLTKGGKEKSIQSPEMHDSLYTSPETNAYIVSV